MSDNWITLIPTQPNYVPATMAIDEAEAMLRKHYHSDEPIAGEVSPRAKFHNPLANLESVSCPYCNSDLTDTFFAWCDELADEEGELEAVDVEVPCCGRTASLNNLKFEMPAGFSRFSISLMNPNVFEISPPHVEELQKILGATLRQVFIHL